MLPLQLAAAFAVARPTVVILSAAKDPRICRCPCLRRRPCRSCLSFPQKTCSSPLTHPHGPSSRLPTQKNHTHGVPVLPTRYHGTRAETPRCQAPPQALKTHPQPIHSREFVHKFPGINILRRQLPRISLKRETFSPKYLPGGWGVVPTGKTAQKNTAYVCIRNA